MNSQGIIEREVRAAVSDYESQFTINAERFDELDGVAYFEVEIEHSSGKKYEFQGMVKRNGDCLMDYNEDCWEDINECNLFKWLWFEEVL